MKRHTMRTLIRYFLRFLATVLYRVRNVHRWQDVAAQFPATISPTTFRNSW
jgi:hypothetical protein